MTSTWSNGPVTLYTGHVTEVLRGLSAESVQCIVTSPPYWGLRNYQLEPVVWDADLGGCEHKWVNGTNKNIGRHDTERMYQDGNGPIAFDVSQGALCLRCGAWRGSLGLEPTPQLYVQHLVAVMREVRRVLRNDGVCFLNMGDTYATQGGTPRDEAESASNRVRASERGYNVGGWSGATEHIQRAVSTAVGGLKPKDLVGIPWRVALALQEDGWWLRSDIIWAKLNPMPESVTDRPTRSHEYIFLLTKAERYFWDQEAVREVTGNEPSQEIYNRVKAEVSKSRWYSSVTHTPSEGKKSTKPTRAAGISIASITPPGGRNIRSVWTIPTQPMPLEWCKGCGKAYGKAEYAYLRRGSVARCQTVIEPDADEKCGSTAWAFAGGVVACLECGAVYTPAQHKKLPMAKRCNQCQDDQWGSHFATFPEALVERCILAGTSEWGCCPECGAPWERVVKKESAYEGARRHDNLEKLGLSQGTGWKGGPEAMPKIEVLGWRPTCAHAGLSPVPCTILDPFSGAGTVVLVSQKLGRRAIGIDLNPKYNELAVKRLEAVPLPMGAG